MAGSERVAAYIKAMGGTGFDRGEDVVETRDGGVAVAGYSSSFGDGSDCVLVLKLDAMGELLWATLLEGWGDEFSFGIVETSDGGFAVTGSSTGVSTVGGKDVLVAKVDADGTFVWAKTIGGASTEECYRITEDGDGNLYVAGDTSSVGAGDTDALVVKLDPDGELMWFRTFGGTGSDHARTVTVAPDGSIAVIGFTNSNRASTSYDGLVIVLDTDGEVLWSKTVYAEATYQTWWDIQPTGDGDWACIGFTTAFGAGDADMFIFRLDSDGAMLQAVTVGGTGQDDGYGVVETTDAGLVVIGYSHSFGEGGATDADAIIAKVHANGTLAWARVLGGVGSGYHDQVEEAYAIAAASNGNLVVVGHTQSFGDGTDSVLLTQLLHDGSIPNCSFALAAEPEVSDITSSVSVQNTQWMVVSSHAVHNTFVALASVSAATSLEQEVDCIAFTRTAGHTQTITQAITQAITTTSATPASPAYRGTTAARISVATASAAVGDETSAAPMSPATFNGTKGFLLTITESIANTSVTTAALAATTAGATTGAPFMGDALYFKVFGGSGLDAAEDMVRMADGSVAVAGVSDGFGAGTYNVLVVQLDAEGAVVWANTLKRGADEGAFGITQTMDGGVAVAGFSTSALSAGGMDVMVAKLDADGEYLWARIIGGSGDEEAFRISEGVDGSLWVVGATASFGAGDVDAFVIKLDQGGELLWMRTFGGTGADDGMALSAAPDGGAVVIGVTDSTRGGSTYDAFVLRLDAAGETLWAKTMYTESKSNNAWRIKPTSDGDGWIVVGTSAAYGASGDDAVIFRLNDGGSLVHAVMLRGEFADFANDIVETSDKGLAVVGGYGLDSTDDSYAPVVAKVHANGTLAWAKVLDSIGTTAHAIVETAGGDLALTGQTDAGDILLVKLDAGGEVGNCSALQSILLEVVDVTGGVFMLDATSWMTTTEWYPWESPLMTSSKDVSSLLTTADECIQWLAQSETATTTAQRVFASTGPPVSTLPAINVTGESLARAFHASRTYVSAFGGGGFDRGEGIYYTSDGGVVVAGYSTSFGDGTNDVIVAKLDVQGELSWARSLRGWSAESSYAVTGTLDGGFAVTGSVTGAGGDKDVLIAKLDDRGVFVWAVAIGGSSSEECFRIAETSNGTLVATGATASFGEGNSDVLVVSVDSDGELLWLKTFGDEDTDEARGLALTPEDGIVIVGFTNSNRGVSGYDALVIRLDPDGQALWSKTVYTDSSYQTWWDIAATRHGGWVFTGFTTVSGAGDADVLIVRLDADGGFVQAITLGGEGQDNGYGIVQTLDDGLAVSGYTASYGGSDALIAKLSANGTLLWARVLGATGAAHVDDDEEAYAIQQTPDGNLVVVGHTQSFGGGSDSLMVAQLNANGYISNCTALQPIEPQVSDVTTETQVLDASFWLKANSYSSSASSVSLASRIITSLCSEELECRFTGYEPSSTTLGFSTTIASTQLSATVDSPTTRSSSAPIASTEPTIEPRSGNATSQTTVVARSSTAMPSFDAVVSTTPVLRTPGCLEVGCNTTSGALAPRGTSISPSTLRVTTSGRVNGDKGTSSGRPLDSAASTMRDSTATSTAIIQQSKSAAAIGTTTRDSANSTGMRRTTADVNSLSRPATTASATTSRTAQTYVASGPATTSTMYSSEDTSTETSSSPFSASTHSFTRTSPTTHAEPVDSANWTGMRRTTADVNSSSLLATTARATTSTTTQTYGASGPATTSVKNSSEDTSTEISSSPFSASTHSFTRTSPTTHGEQVDKRATTRSLDASGPFSRVTSQGLEILTKTTGELTHLDDALSADDAEIVDVAGAPVAQQDAVIIGSSVGGVVVLAIVAVLIVYFIRRKARDTYEADNVRPVTRLRSHGKNPRDNTRATFEVEMPRNGRHVRM